MIKAVDQSVSFKANENKKPNSNNVAVGAGVGTAAGLVVGALVKKPMTTEQLVNAVSDKDKFDKLSKSVGNLEGDKKTAFDTIKEVVDSKATKVEAAKTQVADLFGKEGDKAVTELPVDTYLSKNKEIKENSLDDLTKSVLKDEDFNTLEGKAKGAKTTEEVAGLQNTLDTAKAELTATPGDAAKKTAKEAAEKALEDAKAANIANESLEKATKQKNLLKEVQEMITETDGKKVISLAKAQENAEAKVTSSVAKAVEDNAKKIADSLKKVHSWKNIIIGGVVGIVAGAIVGKLASGSKEKAPKA